MSLQQQLGPLLPAVVAGPFPQYVNVGRCRWSFHGGRPLALPLWRELADEPCEDCDRHGNWIDLPLRPGGEPIQRDDCAECHGTGRKVHTLTVKCDECDGKGSAYADDDLDELGNLDRAADTEYGNPGIEVAFDCTDCGGEGIVSVDVTVRLVSVVEWAHADWWAGRSFVALPSSPVALPHSHDGRGTVEITPLGDPLTPGDWVAIIEAVPA